MQKFNQMTLEKYLSELSSEAPVPGGGSVSAYTAALAMGLSQMVGRITLKRKPKKDQTPEQMKERAVRQESIEKLVNALEKAKRDAFQVVNLDPEVYQEVMDAYKQPDKLGDALQNSFRLQADLAFLVIMAREWNQELAGLVSGSVKNDLLVSAAMLEAAFRGAYHTATINVVYMKDQQRRERAEQVLDELKHRFDKGARDVAEANKTA